MIDNDAPLPLTVIAFELRLNDASAPPSCDLVSVIPSVIVSVKSALKSSPFLMMSPPASIVESRHAALRVLSLMTLHILGELTCQLLDYDIMLDAKSK